MTQPKLSVTSKLDGIPSWSLEAVRTCPGAHEGGELVEVCQGCYARGGNYRFPAVKDAREVNRQAWKDPGFVATMIRRIQPHAYFRWFDSGDIYTYKLALKIQAIIAGTPGTQHWLPTRSHKFPKLRRVIQAIGVLPNAVVRCSGDRVHEAPNPADYTHQSVVYVPGHEETLAAGTHPCPAYKSQPAACNGCRACWDPSVPAIAYPAHGQKMKPIIRRRTEHDGAALA